MSDVTKSPYLYWIFSVGPDYFFTKNRYSWISHANLAIWWWRSSKVSSRSVFVFACHVIILNNNYSWIFLCYFSNNKKKTYWWFIGYICNIYLILENWKHCDVADMVLNILLEISVQPSWKYYFSSRHG